jgi:hypothetical protein
MVNHKDDWRQQPRMGKRKRQVLRVLAEAYSSDAAESGDPEVEEPQWGWMTREEILVGVISVGTGKKIDQTYSPMTGLVLEVAPQALQVRYHNLADTAHQITAGTYPPQEGWAMLAKKLEDFQQLENLVKGSLLPLRHGFEFKKRWGATRSSCYAAIRALEKQGFIESEEREASQRAGLLHFRITPARRESLRFC